MTPRCFCITSFNVLHVAFLTYYVSKAPINSMCMVYCSLDRQARGVLPVVVVTSDCKSIPFD